MPRISGGGDTTIVAQNRRRRRRGRRSRTAKPTKKTKPKKKSAKSDKGDGNEVDDTKKSKKSSKKKVKSKKAKKKAKKKAPKVAEKKGPLLPENFGKIVMYSGAGLAAVGLGVAGWGATVHNGAVAERHRLQDREANNSNQYEAFYDLHSDMETGKNIHYAGLGIAGFAALTVAVGSLF